MQNKLPLLPSGPGGVRKSAFHGPWRGVIDRSARRAARFVSQVVFPERGENAPSTKIQTPDKNQAPHPNGRQPVVAGWKVLSGDRRRVECVPMRFVTHTSCASPRARVVLARCAAREVLRERFRAKATMFGRKDKKHSLYYLLPGMTRANREKRRRVFWYSVVVGILVAALAGGIVYWANLGPRP